MWEDHFFLVDQRQPLGNFSWDTAAVRFVLSRDQFLTFVPDKPAPVGIWHETCFPFKGYLHCVVTADEIMEMRTIVSIFRSFSKPRRYDTNVGVRELFKEHLAYPPYSLADNWDGNASKRLLWAEECLRKQEKREH